MTTTNAPKAQAASTSQDRQDIIESLSETPPRISPKYFYDERGSKLFEAITETPEYYPTSTELSILHEHIDEIAAALGDDVSLIEFGAGASVKVRVLLESIPGISVFVPVDISADHLKAAAKELAKDYPDVEIHPVGADFTNSFRLPSPEANVERNIVFFPGSTIGNFPPAAARELLKTMRATAKDSGGLLIGVDLKKDAETLERAYNDAAGITAEFNRNMLTHLNELIGANFRPEAYEHRAIYNETEGRIEMHLVSTCRQTINIGDAIFELNKGEYILTECSYKFSREEFAELAESAGFRVKQVWTDPDELFTLQYCESI